MGHFGLRDFSSDTAVRLRRASSGDCVSDVEEVFCFMRRIRPHNLFFDGKGLFSVYGAQFVLPCQAWKRARIPKGLVHFFHLCCFSPQTLPCHHISHCAHTIRGWTAGIYKWEDVLHWPLEEVGMRFTLERNSLYFGSGSLLLGESWLFMERQLNRGRVYWNYK